MKRVIQLQPLLHWLVVAAALVYCALFIFNSVTRTGRFSPDSMSYVNVAKSILAGKGLTQPTLGFNQQHLSIDQKPPVPYTEQAPLYPLMIAAGSHLGISPARTALLLSALANVALIFLVYAFAAKLYDKNVALLAAALLLFHSPLRWITGWAWTEALALDLLLVSFWLLAKARPENRLHLVFAGLLGGLALATRYAFAPLLAVGALFLICRPRPWKQRSADVFIYALAFALPAGAVFLHNYFVAGALVTSYHIPRTGFQQNLREALAMAFGGYLDVFSMKAQIALLALSTFAFCVVLAVRGQLLRGLREIFLSDGAPLLLLWMGSYLAFLVVQRCSSYFDLDSRTVSPVGPSLIILWSALFVRATRLRVNYTAVIALILFGAAIAREAQATIKTPALDFQKTIQNSGRLRWIAENTSEKDLIIGDNVVDVPFYLNHDATLSFSPHPYTDFLTYEKVIAYVQMHCHDYEHFYLAITTPPVAEDTWRVFFGDFITDLVFGYDDRYPGLIPLARFQDGCVFEIKCR